MKFKFITVIIFILSIQTFSQDLLTGLTYSIALPTGDTRNFISEPSFTGLSLDLRKFVADNVSLDFLVGWNGFEEETIDLISIPYADISGTQRRLMNIFPVMIGTHYYFGEGTEFRPFIGAGVGMYFIYQKFELGLAELESSKWHLGIEVDAGMVYLLDTIYALINVRYHYAFKATNEITQRSTSHAYWAFNIGLALTPLTYF
jgi:outer membrane protein W